MLIAAALHEGVTRGRLQRLPLELEQLLLTSPDRRAMQTEGLSLEHVLRSRAPLAVTASTTAELPAAPRILGRPRPVLDSTALVGALVLLVLLVLSS